MPLIGEQTHPGEQVPLPGPPVHGPPQLTAAKAVGALSDVINGKSATPMPNPRTRPRLEQSTGSLATS
ncbi:MAG: hypothetical protein ACR2H4_20145 [Pyrinomonadaceae bacterium]